MTLSLLIAIALLADSTLASALALEWARSIQLTIGLEEKTPCRSAPASWDFTAPEDWVTTAAVSEDLRRYFAGLSFQATPLLPAVSHGRFRFCLDSDERVVAETLAEVVIRLAPASLPSSSDLPAAAPELLSAFASPILEERLRAFNPASSEEAARKTAALEVVRSAMTERR